uniref:Alpha-type protein kinase domain-containing protein n=1 Tax=Myripristis murdjan TaxID=586833 RepID=A0A667Y4I2_9TELE
MDSQEVGALLEDCLRAANAKAKAKQPSPPSGEAGLSFCRYRDSLCAELASLLHEAVEMKWPFVPEKWQYKQAVSTKDKTNLTDLISQHLHQLLALLKAAIMAQEARWALAVVFLVDRFLYWTDDSSRLLKITKLLHRCHPDAPVAPQLVIRQARVYLNAGKLQKAEYILSSLINNSGATGCWVYHSESDRALVQAVSVQVRGLVLQKLGLWLEAAELIWASLVGYYALPQPDKKGIGMSLGILANLLVSMNDEDYHAFRTNPDVDLSALGDRSHRLLSAAEAAKMAVVYSQYTSLFVLTHVATQGTCLLSYSFSAECPSSERDSYLLQAKEAFEVGLLTKTEGELVTSKQELHTFLKAAYSLTVTHKWLGTSSEVLTQATQACQKALALFYDYCHAASQERDSLCADIMHLVVQVKLLLQVEPFPSSDRGSFIPDSYRNIKDRPVNFTLAGFARVMGRFQKYHASLCEATDKNKKQDKPGHKSSANSHAVPRSLAHVSSSCNTGSDSEKFEVIEAAQETVGSEEDWIPDVVDGSLKPTGTSGAAQSLSQLTLRTSSSSLNDSFSSRSSWEKISSYTCSPANNNPNPAGQSKPIGLSSKSTESDESFYLIETPDSEASDSTNDPKHQSATSGRELRATSNPQPLQSFDVDPNAETEMCSVPALFDGLEAFPYQEAHPWIQWRSRHPLQLPLNPCVSFSLGGLHLKFSRATGLWTARETCLYVGDEMGEEGKQRRAIWVQFLHQEERLSNYVGKDYLEPKEIQFHFKDVERQMTAQYYVTEFNKSLYDKEIMAQIFFIPSEALLILSGDEIVGCITVEPYMLGDFVKLTNNTVKKDMRFQATEYGIAFGHFTYLFSDCQEVVVDLQGWVTANGKGLTYLTDPQIHSSKTPMGRSNFAERGLRCFLEEQHGPECNDICRKLKLPNPSLKSLTTYSFRSLI